MREVRRLRQARKWNQAELAFHAGLAPSVISEIETGKRDPSAGTLRKLANALEVEVPDLFGRSEDLKAQAPLPFDEQSEDAAERRYLIPLLDSYTRMMTELRNSHEPRIANLSKDLPPSTSLMVFQWISEFLYTCELIEYSLNETGVDAVVDSLIDGAEDGEDVPADLLQKAQDFQEAWSRLLVTTFVSAHEWKESQWVRPEVMEYQKKEQANQNERLAKKTGLSYIDHKRAERKERAANRSNRHARGAV
jgi:transcriptional regulator with XRE-family HTH domain